MRAILFAMLVATGVALVGAPNVSAAPANGAAAGDAATATDIAGQVQHWRWGSGGGEGGHWRWGSRGGGYDEDDIHSPRRSHWRRGSRGPGPGCPVVCRHRPWTSERVCVQRC